MEPISTAIIAALVQNAVPLVASIIGMVVAWAGKKTTEYVSQKTKNEAVNNAIQHITHTASTIVADLEQTVVPYYVRESVDGKLTKDQRSAVKKIAMDRIKKQVPESVMALALIAVNSLDDLLSGKVEQAVINLKK